MNWKINKKHFIYLLFATAFIFFRIVEINRPFWSDELITIKTTYVNPFTNPLYSEISTNLPLFYYAVKIFETLTFGNVSLRYLNVLLSALTIYFIYKKYENLNKITKLFLLLFLIVSPLQIYYSIELRAYALAQLLIIINFYYFQKKDFNRWFWITAYLLTLTHYSCYVYLLSIFIFYLIQNKNNWSQIYKFISLGVFSVCITYLISKNSGFSDSTNLSVINNNFSRFTLSNFIENLMKIREIVAVYYNFGLHYYRIENSFLSIIKKLTQILIGLYFMFIIINIKKYKEQVYNLLFLGCLLFISIILDLSGIMPFGGRYVFPFHFFFLLLLGSCINLTSQINRYLPYLIFVIFIASYISYDACLSINLEIFRGNNDPQGSIYQKCIEKIS